MNATPNFSSILDEAPTEVSMPPLMPEGTYLWTVQPSWEDGKANTGTEFIKFKVTAVSALEDVDEEELSDYGPVAGKVMDLTFWKTEDSIYRLDAFHEHCGLDLSVKMSRKLRNDEVANASFLGTVKHKQDRKDPKKFRAEISATAPAE